MSFYERCPLTLPSTRHWERGGVRGIFQQAGWVYISSHYCPVQTRFDRCCPQVQSLNRLPDQHRHYRFRRQARNRSILERHRVQNPLDPGLPLVQAPCRGCLRLNLEPLLQHQDLAQHQVPLRRPRRDRHMQGPRN